MARVDAPPSPPESGYFLKSWQVDVRRLSKIHPVVFDRVLLRAALALFAVNRAVTIA